MEEILKNMIEWARQAGEIQLGYFRGDNLGIASKRGESDIVTNADKESESLLLGKIHANYPGHAILSEEAGQEGSDQAEWLWVIDPLDGTTNFGNGLPIFSISIGLRHWGQTVAGVVHAPYLGETYWALKGAGAFLNGRPIRVSGKTSAASAVVCTGFPVDKDVNPDNNVDNFNDIICGVRAVRCLGSAAMDLCFCAAGYLDGFWEIGLHEWDVCAGALIVEEAGGKFTRFRDDHLVSLVTGTPAIHDWLLGRVHKEARKA